MKAMQALLDIGDVPRPHGQGGEIGVAPLFDGSLHSFKAGKDKTRSKVLLAVWWQSTRRWSFIEGCDFILDDIVKKVLGPPWTSVPSWHMNTERIPCQVSLATYGALILFDMILLNELC